MPQITNTYQLAYDACSVYFVRTKAMPSVAAIIAEIGINSPATVAKAVKDWKHALAEDYSAPWTQVKGIPDGLQQGFIDLWHKALSDANSQFIDQLNDLTRREKRRIEREANLVLENREKERLFDKKTTELLQSLSIKDLSLAEAKAKLAEHTQTIADLKKQLAEAKAVLNEEKINYEQLKNQYEALNNWYLMRIEQEKELLKRK